VPRRLVLVRHAAVRVQSAVATSRWELSDDGRLAAAELRRNSALAKVGLIVTSPEPKATATAIALADGRPVLERDDLRELDRSAAGWLCTELEYVALVAEILASPARSARGCEPAAAAQQRLVRVVGDLLASSTDDVAVVSHGIVLSLYLAHVRGKASVDLEAWRRMRMPDLAVVDADRAEVLVDFGTV